MYSRPWNRCNGMEFADFQWSTEKECYLALSVSMILCNCSRYNFPSLQGSPLANEDKRLKQGRNSSQELERCPAIGDGYSRPSTLLQFPITLQLHSRRKGAGLARIGAAHRGFQLKAAASEGREKETRKEQFSAAVVPGLLPERNLSDLFNCAVNSCQHWAGRSASRQELGGFNAVNCQGFWKMIQ
jgi:hypothetical protein